MRARVVLSLLLAGVIAVFPSVAAAQPPFTETVHDQGSATEMDVVCSGAVVPIEIDFRSVFHITDFGDGRYHITGTQVGTFTTTDAGVTYTGTFAVWFGENSNNRSFNGTFTFNARGAGSDGSRVRLHGVSHITVNALGETTTTFEEFDVVCG